MNHHDFVERLGNLDRVSFDPEDDTRYAIQAYTVDFIIGSRDMYPSPFGDDLPRMLTRSSVSLAPEGDDYSIMARDDMPEEFADDWNAVCDEATIHLPPYRQDQKEDIEACLDLRDEFQIRYGTTGLGSKMPPANWGLTPHIELTAKECSVERILCIIREAANVTEQVQYMSEEEVREAYADD